jgi:hypothetical protein
MKKILFKLLLRYLQKNGYEYSISNKTHGYMNYHGNIGLYNNPTETLIIPASGDYLQTKVPSTKLEINPDAGHIETVNDIVPNSKGNIRVNPKKKLYIKKTKKGDSAGMGITSSDMKFEVK